MPGRYVRLLLIGRRLRYGAQRSVGVGRDHDTPAFAFAFAVASIRQRWTMVGRRAYPQATALLITADASGSHGYRARVQAGLATLGR